MLSRAEQLGPYLLHRQIGRGGMADVYEAEMQSGPGVSKRVALKVLLPELRNRDQVLKSFIDEATLAARLTHPNIVQVFDFGRQGDVLFIAMELVDGLTLQQVIRRSHETGPPLPVGAAIYIVHEVALALSYIHSLEPSIIHRDVTPHNIFITHSGHIKLGDFGIAKSALGKSYTVTGEIKGKLAYLAPEQVRGDPLTESLDVYAAGLILFELATGERLLKGSNELALIQSAQSPRLIPPSRLNPAAALLDAVVERALQPHPAMRLPSATMLCHRLEQLMPEVPPFGAPELVGLMRELESQRPALVLEPGGETGSTTAPYHGTEAATATGTPSLSPAPRPRPRAPAARTFAIAAAGVLLLAVAAWILTQLVSDRLPSERPPAPRRSRAAAPGPGPHAPAPAPLPSADAVVVTGEEMRLKDRRAPPPAKKRPLRRGPGAKRERSRQPPPAPAPAPKRTSRELALLLQRARQRGLWPGDSPEYSRKVAAVRQAIRDGSGDDAALRDLKDHVERFNIDRSFANAKLARLEHALKRAKVSGESSKVQKILRLILADRLVEASRLISVEMGLLAPR